MLLRRSGREEFEDEERPERGLRGSGETDGEDEAERLRRAYEELQAR